MDCRQSGGSHAAVAAKGHSGASGIIEILASGYVRIVFPIVSAVIRMPSSAIVMENAGFTLLCQRGWMT